MLICVSTVAMTLLEFRLVQWRERTGRKPDEDFLQVTSFEESLPLSEADLLASRKGSLITGSVWRKSPDWRLTAANGTPLWSSLSRNGCW